MNTTFNQIKNRVVTEYNTNKPEYKIIIGVVVGSAIGAIANILMGA